MKRPSLLVSLILLLMLTGLCQALLADEPEPGVARVSLINGDVSTMRGDSGDWVATTINTPLVQGDKIATGPRSRTEIQLDYANTLRLDQSSEARIADISGKHIQVQLSEGLLNLSVAGGSESEVEIDTPNVAVRPIKNGVYRVQVNSNSDTEVIVRKGEAEVSTSQGNTRVRQGELITVRGQDIPEYKISQAPRDDSWDDWNETRDRAIRDASSWRHANSYYTGVHDLDPYGRWVYVPGYDYVWSPYVDAGWAPYRQGRWLSEPYWGWTWVSYEPWGWAPYHYGRWFQHNSSWCWWPGRMHAAYRPVWAPAYVSFLGFGFGGRNWSFGFGFGYNSIGWMPVGPCDYYYPWHGHRNYYNAINVTNITNIYNGRDGYGAGGIRPLADTKRQPYYSNLQTALNNPRSQQGLTAVSTDNFVHGRMGAQDRITNGISLRDAQLVRGTVPAVPTRESLRPVDRAVNPASLPRQSASPQRFFTSRQPPAGPQPFNQRVAELRRMVQTSNPQAEAGQGGDIGRGRTDLTANSPSGARASGRPEASGNSMRTLTGQRNETPRSLDRSGASMAPATSATDPSAWQRFSRGNVEDRSRAGLRNGSDSTQAPSASRTTDRYSPAQSSSPNSRQSLERSRSGLEEGRMVDRTGASSMRSAPTAPDSRNNWQRFSSAGRESNLDRAPGASSTGSRAGLGGDRFGRTEQAPSTRSEAAPRSDRYDGTTPADRSFRTFPSRSQSSSPQWDRFPSSSGTGSESRQDMRSPSRSWGTDSGGRGRAYEAPRSNSRPPLQMNRPIVTERSSGNSGGGGRQVTRSDSRGSAPASSPRSSGHGRR
jgi:hypothetical protein